MSDRERYLDAFRVYWKGYGGFFQIVFSPYFLAAMLLWAFCKPIWFDQWKDGGQWVEWPLTIIPSMVSFSLGAMAIFLALSNERFLKILRQGGKEKSYLIKVTTAFFHFIVVQFLALFLAILLVAYPSVVFSAFAFLIFLYGLMCGLSAAAALLDMADILNYLGKLDE